MYARTSGALISRPLTPSLAITRHFALRLIMRGDGEEIGMRRTMENEWRFLLGHHVARAGVVGASHAEPSLFLRASGRSGEASFLNV